MNKATDTFTIISATSLKEPKNDCIKRLLTIFTSDVSSEGMLAPDGHRPRSSCNLLQ